MARFVKKPVEIEAIQISLPMTVETLEGIMKGKPGDWLITGVKGEQYFCDNEIFRMTYNPIDITWQYYDKTKKEKEDE